MGEVRFVFQGLIESILEFIWYFPQTKLTCTLPVYVGDRGAEHGP